MDFYVDDSVFTNISEEEVSGSDGSEEEGYSSINVDRDRFIYIRSCFEYLINNKDSTPITILKDIPPRCHSASSIRGKKKLVKTWAILSIAKPNYGRNEEIIAFVADLGDGLREHRLTGFFNIQYTGTTFGVALEEVVDVTYKIVEGRSKFEMTLIDGDLKIGNTRLKYDVSDLRTRSIDIYDRSDLKNHIKTCLEYLINNANTTPIRFSTPLETMISDDDFRTVVMVLDERWKSQKANCIISFDADLGDGNKEHKLKARTEKVLSRYHRYDLIIRRAAGLYFVGGYRFQRRVRIEDGKSILTNEELLVKALSKAVDLRPKKLNADCELALVVGALLKTKKQRVERRSQSKKLRTTIDASTWYIGKTRPQIIEYLKSCIDYLSSNKDTVKIDVPLAFNREKYRTSTMTGKGRSAKTAKYMINLATDHAPKKARLVVTFDADLGGGFITHKLFGYVGHSLGSNSLFNLSIEEKVGNCHILECFSRDEPMKNTREERNESIKNTAFHIKECFEYLINNLETEVTLLRDPDDLVYAHKVRVHLWNVADKISCEDILSFEADLGDGLLTYKLKGRFITMKTAGYYLELRPDGETYLLSDFDALTPLVKIDEKLVVSGKKEAPAADNDDVEFFLGILPAGSKRSRPEEPDKLDLGDGLVQFLLKKPTLEPPDI